MSRTRRRRRINESDHPLFCTPALVGIVGRCIWTAGMVHVRWTSAFYVNLEPEPSELNRMRGLLYSDMDRFRESKTVWPENDRHVRLSSRRLLRVLGVCDLEDICFPVPKRSVRVRDRHGHRARGSSYFRPVDVSYGSADSVYSGHLAGYSWKP